MAEINQRDRGLSAGQFLVSVAQAQMYGAEFRTGLDRRRADVAGETARTGRELASAGRLISLVDDPHIAGTRPGVGGLSHHGPR